MPNIVHKLAKEFAASTDTQWHELAKSALRGSDFNDALVRRSEDGLALGPLFTKTDCSLAVPNHHSQKINDQPWQISCQIEHPDIDIANSNMLADLQGGANALLLKIDPTGNTGIAVQQKSDIARLFSKVHTNLISLRLSPSENNLESGALFTQYFIDTASIQDVKFSLGYAPILPTNNKFLSLASWAVKNAPHWQVFTVNATTAHEAGATAAQELAYMAALGVAYLRALQDDGHNIRDVLPLIDIHIASDQDSHQSICKIRAARLIWSKIAHSFGANNAVNSFIHVSSSNRMLAKADPWSNLLRLNSACFGAVCGGADSISIAPFTQPLGLATLFARRLARNIQLLQMEEAHLGHVQDPAHGSYMHETLTHELAEKAWSVFQHMESLGGWPNANNWLRGQITKAHKSRLQKIKSGEILLVGVNQFTKPDIRPADILPRPKVKQVKGSPIKADIFQDVLKQIKDGKVLPAHTNKPLFPSVRLSEELES